MSDGFRIRPGFIKFLANHKGAKQGRCSAASCPELNFEISADFGPTSSPSLSLHLQSSNLSVGYTVITCALFRSFQYDGFSLITLSSSYLFCIYDCPYKPD